MFDINRDAIYLIEQPRFLIICCLSLLVLYVGYIVAVVRYRITTNIGGYKDIVTLNTNHLRFGVILKSSMHDEGYKWYITDYREAMNFYQDFKRHLNCNGD